MPKFLPFPDALSASTRNRAIAKRLGCNRNPGVDVTTEWFSVIAKADPEDAGDRSTEVAMVVSDDEFPYLDLLAPGRPDDILKPSDAKALPVKPETVAALKTDAELKASGWHPLKDTANVDLEAPPIVAGMKLSSDWLWTNAIQPIARLFG